MRGGSFHLPRTPQARGDKCTTTREPRPCRAGVLVFPRSRRFYGPPSPRVRTLTIRLKAGMVVADDSRARHLSSPRTTRIANAPPHLLRRGVLLSGASSSASAPRAARTRACSRRTGAPESGLRRPSPRGWGETARGVFSRKASRTGAGREIFPQPEIDTRQRRRRGPWRVQRLERRTGRPVAYSPARGNGPGHCRCRRRPRVVVPRLARAGVDVSCAVGGPPTRRLARARRESGEPARPRRRPRPHGRPLPRRGQRGPDDTGVEHPPTFLGRIERWAALGRDDTTERRTSGRHSAALPARRRSAGALFYDARQRVDVERRAPGGRAAGRSAAWASNPARTPPARTALPCVRRAPAGRPRARGATWWPPSVEPRR